VAALVDVFREVRRVLRDDGTVWLNLGDSFCSTDKWGGGVGGNTGKHTTNGADVPSWAVRRRREHFAGVKPKDLLGIPWLVVEALKAPYYTGTIKDERDRIWLAAMIDAEGCMFIHKRKVGQSNGQGYVRKNDSYGAGLEISSTDRVIVENVLRITGRGSICEQGPEQNDRRKQTLYRWNLRSNECRDVIREVYPYLVAKQHEARLVLGCPSSGLDAERAHESLKAIHQGGAPTIDFAAPEPMFERGWFLRSDIIWSKLSPNPMPESVTDRPTKSHEYLFLLSKRATYHYDADAIRESSDHPHLAGKLQKVAYHDESALRQDGDRIVERTAERNKRSVWTVATQRYPGAHFATFPPKLIEPCILAGCPERACSECGAPWERVAEHVSAEPAAIRPKDYRTHHGAGATSTLGTSNSHDGALRNGKTRTLGFAPTCAHDTITTPGIVLDPFAGSGTTGLVALRHGRSFIGIESNAEYVELARWRIVDDAPLLNSVAEIAARGYAHGMSETQTPDPQREQQQPDQPEQQPEADPTAPEPGEQPQPERDPAEGEPRRGVPAEP
jgi:DNA modification methylase